MVKSSVKTKKKAVSKKKITKDSILKNQNTRIGIILGVILILLMLMANTWT